MTRINQAEGVLSKRMKKSYIKYIAALLLFGSNGIIASHISLTSYEIVLSRTLIGGLFLIAVYAIGRNRPDFLKDRKTVLCLAVSGVAMGLNWLFLYEAYTQIGVSISTLACYCGPVILMALSPLVFREKLTAAKLIGIVAVLAGMFCVYGTELAKSGFSWGLVFGVLSAVMYPVMVIFNKKAEKMSGIENSMSQLVVAFVTVAVFTLIKDGALVTVPQGSILPILLLGIVNTGLGCYMYFSSLRALPAQTVAVCGYLEPLSALGFSAVFLGERLTLLQIAGAALVLGGAAFAELFKPNRKKTAETAR